MPNGHIYLCIDLKSFYASVECVDRGLDPLTTNLVVADVSRTEKTICLAVSPSLKKYGIPGRARLFQVVQKAKEAGITYIAATPRMSRYMEISTQIYHIYLKYIAPEDIIVYSIDEVFMDLTHYLDTYHLSAHELGQKMIQDVLSDTGITATAGIGTNLYLCKVAMDIVAKHVTPDDNGIRIASLDEMSYRKLLWSHRPLTDFWRVGRGYAKKLEAVGLNTMGDIARCSLGKPNEFYNEELLYRMFGINAELLIDHAWGYEPCTMSEIKAYKPSAHSISTGQVLSGPYPYEKTKLIVREMTELLSLDLVEKGVVTNQLVLTIGYDVESLTNPEICRKYHGEITIDSYGRQVPKHAHGTTNLTKPTSSTKLITNAVMELFDRIIDKNLLSRRINIAANSLTAPEAVYEQLDLFDDQKKQAGTDTESLEREHQMQKAVLKIKKKYGNNAILKGMNLEEGGTTIERNNQIGGHKK